MSADATPQPDFGFGVGSPVVWTDPDGGEKVEATVVEQDNEYFGLVAEDGSKIAAYFHECRKLA